MTWLNGKKSYIVAGAAILYAWVGVWAGTLSADQAMEMTFGALGLGTIRHAIAAK